MNLIIVDLVSNSILIHVSAHCIHFQCLLFTPFTVPYNGANPVEGYILENYYTQTYLHPLIKSIFFLFIISEMSPREKLIKQFVMCMNAQNSLIVF
jgi:hypothetical protein